MLGPKEILALAAIVSRPTITFWSDLSCGAQNGTLVGFLESQDLPCSHFNEIPFKSFQTYNSSCHVRFYEDPMCSEQTGVVKNLQCYDPLIKGPFVTVRCSQTSTLSSGAGTPVIPKNTN